jgi:hypothetical protein
VAVRAESEIVAGTGSERREQGGRERVSALPAQKRPQKKKNRV